MKKYLGFLIVLTLFVLGASNAQATSVPSVCASTATPSITVLSPNGGEVYQSGQQITVKWKSCNSTVANVLIGLRSTVLNEGVEITTTQNDGEEKVTLPTYMGQGNQPLVSGNYYKIGIELGGNPNWSDNSDNTFTINSLSTSTILPDGCNSSVGFSATTGLPCFIDTNSTTAISKNTTVLNGRLIANAPTEVYFKYKKAGNGNETLYTTKIIKQTNGIFSYTLSNLLSNTSYEFRACMYYMGAERCAKLLTFKTLPSSDIQTEETVDQVSVYPSGCNSLVGYSYTTGVKCSSVNCSLSQSGCSGVIAPANTSVSTPASTPTKVSMNRILKVGTKGEDVKTLQSFLNLTADGSFGPKTMNAVKLFQQKNSLTADGIVGPKMISLFK
ncbi:MAG: peptidoglycan-binding domain-containing protein [Candidatus Paceibacterota bacterium]